MSKSRYLIGMRLSDAMRWLIHARHYVMPVGYSADHKPGGFATTKHERALTRSTRRYHRTEADSRERSQTRDRTLDRTQTRCVSICDDLEPARNGCRARRLRESRQSWLGIQRPSNEPVPPSRSRSSRGTAEHESAPWSPRRLKKAGLERGQPSMNARTCRPSRANSAGRERLPARPRASRTTCGSHRAEPARAG